MIIWFEPAIFIHPLSFRRGGRGVRCFILGRGVRCFILAGGELPYFKLTFKVIRVPCPSADLISITELI